MARPGIRKQLQRKKYPFNGIQVSMMPMISRSNPTGPSWFTLPEVIHADSALNWNPMFLLIQFLKHGRVKVWYCSGSISRPTHRVCRVVKIRMPLSPAHLKSLPIRQFGSSTSRMKLKMEDSKLNPWDIPGISLRRRS